MEAYDLFGNEDLLERRTTAFVCSGMVPEEYVGRILEWANHLDRQHCVICGCNTALERQVADILLERGVPMIWVALNLEEVKSQIDRLRSFVLQDRILILALFDSECTLSQSQQQYMRNMAVLEHAHEIVVGYRKPDGQEDRQLAGREVALEIIAPEEPHRYRSFVKTATGGIVIEDQTADDCGGIRIVQKRQVGEEGYIRNDMLSLDAEEAIRLRNALDHVIEDHGWDQSRYLELRKQYPNAYRPWTPDDELLLRQLYLDGRPEEEISRLLGRQPTAIVARLQQLIDQEAARDVNP